MAWTVGHAFSSGTAATLAYTTSNLNDYLVVTLLSNSGSGVITVSGGGVTTWAYLGATVPLTNSAGFSIRIAYGVVTATGAQTITGSATSGTIHGIDAIEYTPPAGTTSVSVDNAQAHATGTSGNLVPASVTPSGATDLYLGMGYTSGTAINGTGSTGFVANIDANSAGFIYSLAAPSPSAPSMTQTGGAWDTLVGTLIPSSGAAALPLRPLVATQARNRAGAF